MKDSSQCPELSQILMLPVCYLPFVGGGGFQERNERITLGKKIQSRSPVRTSIILSRHIVAMRLIYVPFELNFSLGKKYSERSETYRLALDESIDCSLVAQKWFIYVYISSIYIKYDSLQLLLYTTRITAVGLEENRGAPQHSSPML